MPRKNKKPAPPAKKKTSARLKTTLTLGAMVVIFSISTGLLVHDLQTIGRIQASSRSAINNAELTKQYQKLRARADQLIAKSKTINLAVIDVDHINHSLDRIKIELATNRLSKAKANLAEASTELTSYEARLDGIITAQARPTPIPVSADARASVARHYTPIIMYHHTPADFERQLQLIRDRGYTTLTMSEIHNDLADPSKLTAKAVAITFDDGYTDQLNAFALLQKYNMKATFFIITSGQASNWCVGMNRHHDQPQSCGNDFMGEADIKMLDQSGIIEIGDHTVDHLHIDGLGASAQAYQISAAKQSLERLLGHPIYSFAYPYGGFNQSAISQVMASGLTNAVTTVAGTDHNAGDLFTLSRIRDAYKLH